MISEFNIETTVNLISIQTLLSETSPTIYQRVKADSYALIISNESYLKFSVNNNSCSLEPHGVFLCIPGDFLKISDNLPLQSDSYILNFQYSVSVEQFFSKKSSVQIPVKGKINDPFFYNLLNDLLQESAYDIYNYKPRQNILLAYLLLLLCRYHKYNVTESYTAEDSTLPSYVKIVLDYLECNYQNEISSLDIQEQVGLNYDYVNILFKKSVGTTIMKYLDQLRITAAQELLQHTTLQIKDIARRVGIYNPQYFTKKFNLIVGVSPLDYRNRFIFSNKNETNK